MLLYCVENKNAYVYLNILSNIFNKHNKHNT